MIKIGYKNSLKNCQSVCYISPSGDNPNVIAVQISHQSKKFQPKCYCSPILRVQIRTVQKTFSRNSIAVWLVTVQMILIKYYEMCRSRQSDMWLQMLYGLLSGKKFRFLCTCYMKGCCFHFVSFVEVALGNRNSIFLDLVLSTPPA